mgnify:CR=1 FL=1
MLFADKLVPYLRDLQTQTEERYQRLVEQTRQAEGVTEEWKTRDIASKELKFLHFSTNKQGFAMLGF